MCVVCCCHLCSMIHERQLFPATLLSSLSPSLPLPTSASPVSLPLAPSPSLSDNASPSPLLLPCFLFPTLSPVWMCYFLPRQDLGTKSTAEAHSFLRSGKMRLEVRSGAAQAEGGVHDMHSFEKKRW